ncbi:MAG: hypothetical protein WB785_12910 [Mycobacterium sp.]|uniref:hypothetical protein n=1 Tax=Mycobacterium sp. TaxID=1785 RepID=UPI003C6428ED
MDDHAPATIAAESSSTPRVARWAGVLGVVIPAVGIAVYPIWSCPATATSGAEVARWAAAHHDRLVATQVLYTVGVACWFVFSAAVWTYLRHRLPAGSTLAAVFAVGFVGVVTLILSGFTAFNLLLYRPRGAELTTLLYDLTVGLLAMSGIPTAVALGSFAIAVYRYRVLPRPTAHLAVVAATAHVVLLAAFIAPDGPLSLEGFLVIWGIPFLLFAWIMQTAQAMRREAQ